MSEGSFSSTGKTTMIQMLRSPPSKDRTLEKMKSPSKQLLEFFNENHDQLMGKISFRNIQAETFKQALKDETMDLEDNVNKLAKVVK